MPSRGSGLAVAVARTTLSPMRTTTEPCACLASFPVSNEICLPPASSTETSCFMIYFLLGRRTRACVERDCTDEGQEPVALWRSPETHRSRHLTWLGDDRLTMIPMVIRREHPEPGTAPLKPTCASQAYAQPFCNARNRIT